MHEFIGGEMAKRDGMERAERHADPQWWADMLAIGAEVARRKPYFNTDDLERLRKERGRATTHENRAMGPLMLELCRRGICEPTQDWVESRQRINHRRPMRIWYSLMYQGPRFRRHRKRRIINDPRQMDMLDA